MAKVFSVTLDNASSNNKSIQTLAPELSSYVGTIDSDFVGTLILYNLNFLVMLALFSCISVVLVT